MIINTVFLKRHFKKTRKRILLPAEMVRKHKNLKMPYISISFAKALRTTFDLRSKIQKEATRNSKKMSTLLELRLIFLDSVKYYSKVESPVDWYTKQSSIGI